MAIAVSGPGGAKPFAPLPELRRGGIWGTDTGKFYLAEIFLICKEIGFSSQREIRSLKAPAGKLHFSNWLYFLVFFSFFFPNLFSIHHCCGDALCPAQGRSERYLWHCLCGHMGWAQRAPKPPEPVSQQLRSWQLSSPKSCRRSGWAQPWLPWVSPRP